MTNNKYEVQRTLGLVVGMEYEESKQLINNYINVVNDDYRRYLWLISYALTYVADRIVELENRLARYRVVGYNDKDGTMDELHRLQSDYRFLFALKENINDQAMHHHAKAFSEWLRKQK